MAKIYEGNMAEATIKLFLETIRSFCALEVTSLKNLEVLNLNDRFCQRDLKSKLSFKLANH